MGRRKIDVVRIENERHRQVTFAKRKSGLIKKATELAVLCDAQVAVVVFSSQSRMTIYSSVPMEDILTRHRNYTDKPEVTCCPPHMPSAHRVLVESRRSSPLPRGLAPGPYPETERPARPTLLARAAADDRRLLS